jgi:hypothetical protein
MGLALPGVPPSILITIEVVKYKSSEAMVAAQYIEIKTYTLPGALPLQQ